MDPEDKEGLFTTGAAAVDERPISEQRKDYRPEEAFAFGTPLIWKEKTIEEIEASIHATSIDQRRTNRCVTEYGGIALEWAEYIENGVRIPFSRRDFYYRRSGRPSPGMSMGDLFSLMRVGACYENQLPSNGFNDLELDQPYEVTEEMKKARAIHASGASFAWERGQWSIDKFAETIALGIPVCLFWFFNNRSYDEWWREIPRVVCPIAYNDGNPDTGYHQAAAVDFVLVDGKKHIVVMDSAGQGTGLGKQKNLRLVSEDFIKARCYAAGFALDKKNLDYVPEGEIHYRFDRNLGYGSDGDDVMVLQKILVLEGCLSIKTPTRHYRGMTQAAVKKLQEKYADEILKPLGLTQGTGYCYSSTRRFLNAKYA